jgi:hypothetical protein
VSGVSDVTVNPAAFQTPLGKASTILKNLFIKPTAEALAEAAGAVADAARSVAQASAPQPADVAAPSGEGAQVISEPTTAKLRRPSPAPRKPPQTQPLLTDELRLGLHLGPEPAAVPDGASSGTLRNAPDSEWLGRQDLESPGRMDFLRRTLATGLGNVTPEDRTTVYRILTEERTYRNTLVQTLEQRLRAVGGVRPSPAEVQAIRREIQRHQVIQGQIFQHLKALTGRQGKTGGTGFLTGGTF